MTLPGMLHSLPEGYRSVVFGAGGGVGGAFARILTADPRCARVHAGARTPIEHHDPKISPFRFDLEDEASLAAAAARFKADGPVHLVIVATGFLHAPGLAPEKAWRALDPLAMQRIFAVNAIGPALVAKHVLPILPRSGKSAFAALSARVGSISDNRLGGWHSYRASKAALNMIIRTLAIELARSHPGAVCVALHPGTVDTDLSRPFQDGVPSGSLTTPDIAAGRLLGVIDGLSPEQSGRLFGWDGHEIAP